MPEKNIYNREYDNGYNFGKNANAMESISHNLSDVTLPWEDQKLTDSFRAGVRDGAADRYDNDNSHYSGGTSQTSGK